MIERLRGKGGRPMMKGVRYMIMADRPSCAWVGTAIADVTAATVGVCACVCLCVDVCVVSNSIVPLPDRHIHVMTSPAQPCPGRPICPYEMNGRGTDECVRAPRVKRGWLHSDSIEFRQRKSDTSKKQECVGYITGLLMGKSVGGHRSHIRGAAIDRWDGEGAGARGGQLI